jgi:predicted transcriptional regulator
MSKRVTIRLGDEEYEKLQNRCLATNLDSSFLIRDALSKYLADTGTTAQQAKPANTGMAMPDEAFALEGPFRAWSGDLRAEVRKRLKEMLALSHAAAGQFPKTKGIREVYMSVLEAFNQLNDGGH